MALYEELSAINILAPLRPYFKSGQLKVEPDEEGHPVVPLKLVFDYNAPWLNKRWTWQRHCDQWTIYFNAYNFVPRGCRACWKVVMHIANLKQLFSVHEKQKTFGSNCKCGVELRPYTGGLGKYRGYFYGKLNEGLKGGRELRKKVQREFPGISIYLKRGCTEFENRFSPSDDWDKLAEKNKWNFREDLVSTIFRPEKPVYEKMTTKLLEVDVMQRWIEYAFEHGDPTHKEFIEKSLIPEPMKYCSSIHSDKDLIDSIYEPIEKGSPNGLDNNRHKSMEKEGSLVATSDGEEKRSVPKRKSGEEESSITLL